MVMALKGETCSMVSHINNYVKFYVVIEGFSPALYVHKGTVCSSSYQVL
jgi:hypothetical protein